MNKETSHQSLKTCQGIAKLRLGEIEKKLLPEDAAKAVK
jgi:hypothetical protein